MRKLLAGLLFAGVLLALLLRRVELATLAAALSRFEAKWMIPVFLCKAAIVVFKAWRWALAIEGATGARPRRRTVSATLIGFAGNMVLPARLGEVARAAVLRKHNEVPVSLSLTSVGVTQLFDLVVLALILVWLVFQGGDGALLVDQRALGLFFALLAAATTLLVACGRYEHGLRSLLSKFFRLMPTAIERRLDELTENIFSALRVIRAPSHLAGILGYTLLVWVLELIAYGCALGAFQIIPTPAMTILIMVALNLSLMVAVTPGNLGTHQLVCVLVLGLFAVAEATALAFSIGLQSTVQTATIVLGAALFYREGLSLDNLTRHLPSRPKSPS